MFLFGVYLIEVIYGYCFILCLFNGDWGLDLLDVVLVFLCIVKVLGVGLILELVSVVLVGCLESVCLLFFKYVGGYRLVFNIFFFLDIFFSLWLRRCCIVLFVFVMIVFVELEDFKVEGIFGFVFVLCLYYVF